MKIGCDLDGVCCNFGEQFAMVAKHKCNLKLDYTKYDLGIPRDKFLEIYKFMIANPRYIFNMTPYEKTLIVLQEWHLAGHQIIYITRRGGMLDESTARIHEQQTRDWLRIYGFPNHESVIFADNKQKTCNHLGIRILIEDRLEDAREWNSEKLRVYLLNREWNKGTYLHRINSLREVNLG